MSFDLYVWHESEPINAQLAQAKLDRWQAGEPGLFPAHPAVPTLLAALLDRFPPLESLSDADADQGAWSMTPDPDDAVLTLPCAWSRADEVRQEVTRLAAEHGLVCYDPQRRVLDPGAPGHVAVFTLATHGLPTVADPDDARLDQTVRRLSPERFYTILEWTDGWFAQVGHGPSAGVAAGTYALEFREGADGAHLHTTSTDVTEAVRFLQDVRAGRDTWRQRHVWEQW
ncbi:hypothetical protein [Catellatospora citrea]|nr:hypothetical protein [Catellatospora citrea]